jgi:hypothetical protein
LTLNLQPRNGLNYLRAALAASQMLPPFFVNLLILDRHLQR